MQITPPDHWQLRELGHIMQDIVIVDIDGVLADASHRQHLIRGGARNWRDFFEGCDRDALLSPTAVLIEHLNNDVSVVLLTGRPLYVREKTIRWLAQHRVRWDVLIMRNLGDYSNAHLFKEYELQRLINYGLSPRVAVDDDPRNISMFHNAGVPALYVHSGYYEEMPASVSEVREL